MTNHITSHRITTSQVLDSDEALAFYGSHLGFVVCDDIDLGFMRWLTIAQPSNPDHQLLVSVPGRPAHDEATAAQLRDLLAKGALGGIFLTSDDVHSTYAALSDAGVEITQEPIEQPYGTDFGIRDPFGNHVRITELADPTPDLAAEVQERFAEGTRG